MRYFLTLIVALMPCAVTAQTAVTYYVSSESGNDANPGTADQPLRTIQKCVDAWNGTDQVTCNCAGTFHEEVIIRKGGPRTDARNRIVAWDTDGDGDLDEETFVLDGQGVRNVAIAAQNPRPKPDNIEIGWIDFRNYAPDGGCGDGGEVHFIKMKCYETDGCADWWIHHNTFANLAMPCQAGESYIAIRPTHTPNLLVERNRFDSLGGYLMRYVHGSDITFSENYAHVLTAGIKAWGNPTRLKIIDNVFIGDGNGFNPPRDSACGAQNVVNFSNNVQHGVISGNLFVDCVTAIAIGTSDDFGLRDNAHHVIEGNVIYRSDRICNRFNAPIVIDDRSSWNKLGDSMSVYDVSIRNNLIVFEGDQDWNRGAGIELSAGHPYSFNSDIRLYNNTVHGFRWGVRADEAYEPVNNGARYAFQLNGVDLKNNIFSGIRDAQYTLGTNGGWSSASEPTNWSSDYNAFSFANNFAWNGSISLWDWKLQLHRDQLSVLCVPLFDPGDTLYHISSADRCVVDQGMTLQEVVYDIDGDKRAWGTGTDIGADERVGNQTRESMSGLSSVATAKRTAFGLTIAPNPVRRNARIEFRLSEVSIVSATLSDVTGRTTETLLSREEMSAGEHAISLNTVSLEPGIYTLTIQFGQEVLEERVIILE